MGPSGVLPERDEAQAQKWRRGVHVSVKPVHEDMVFMVEPGGRVWIECESFVSYLRTIQYRGRSAAENLQDDTYKYAGLMAVQDAVSQVADSLVVTSLEARDRMYGKMAR